MIVYCTVFHIKKCYFYDFNKNVHNLIISSLFVEHMVYVIQGIRLVMNCNHH